MSRPRPRRRAHWAAYLWPGLAHLWIEGSVAGLTLALAFSVLLNVLILGVLVWPEWLETRMKLGCATAVALLWLLALRETRAELRRLALRAEAEPGDPPPPGEEPYHPNNERLLRDAQRSYLGGDWVAAESALRAALKNDRRDPEARLWLATLLRRTGRSRQALRQLRRLEKLDNAAAWRYELEQEQRYLTAEETDSTDTAEKTTTEGAEDPQQTVAVRVAPNENETIERRAA